MNGQFSIKNHIVVYQMYFIGYANCSSRISIFYKFNWTLVVWNYVWCISSYTCIMNMIVSVVCGKPIPFTVGLSLSLSLLILSHWFFSWFRFIKNWFNFFLSLSMKQYPVKYCGQIAVFLSLAHQSGRPYVSESYLLFTQVYAFGCYILYFLKKLYSISAWTWAKWSICVYFIFFVCNCIHLHLCCRSLTHTGAKWKQYYARLFNKYLQ